MLFQCIFSTPFYLLSLYILGTVHNWGSVRKAREEYLIQRGKTLEPLGMNKKDEM